MEVATQPRGGSLALRRLAAAVPAGVALFLLSAAPAAAGQPPPLQPVKLDRVPLPPGVTSMSFADWTPDGKHLVTGFSSTEYPNNQIGVMREDGSRFSCLTCGLPQIVLPDRPFNAGRPLSLGKPFVFTDGKRVLVRSPGREDHKDTGNNVSGPTADFNYFILECLPSLVRCQDRDLVPLVLPGGGLINGVQNREGRITPDTRWFAWTEVQRDGTRMSMGRLVREAERYVVENVRVLNPQYTLNEDSDQWRLASPLYELKHFSRDGRHVTYASFVDAENYDSFELNLATGERRRLSTDVEWNEDSSFSPDQRLIVNGSSRARDRMAPLAQFPRPPFIDFATYSFTGRFELNEENRTCLLQPWLVSSSGERGTYFGQPLDPGLPARWGSHGPTRWAPDGTKVAFWERSHVAAGTPEDPDARIVVARLRARKPVDEPIGRTPAPTWAVPRDSWDGFTDTAGTFTVRGKRSGTATVTLPGLDTSEYWSVVYQDYSDDGRSFINGFERNSSPFIPSAGRWQADLTMTGEHTGSLIADVAFKAGGVATGTLHSVYDGRTFDSLPTPDCDPLPAPELKPTAKLGRATGGRQLLIVDVRAKVPGDAQLRPVRRAAVRVGGRIRFSDVRGRATVPLALAGGGPISVRAPGFEPARLPWPGD